MFSRLFGTQKPPTASVQKASVQATYEKSPVYFGEDMSGNLTIQCTEPIVIGYVVLEIIGAGASNWTVCTRSGDDGMYEQHSQTNEYLRTAPQVIVEARPNGGLAISETATFNFLTKLPYGNFPSSDSCKIDMYPNSISSARYYCKFSVFDMSNALICSGETDFTAVAHHNYERVEYPRSFTFTFAVFRGGCCCGSTTRGNVHFIADKSVYQPGDVISLTYWVDNTIGDISKVMFTAWFKRITSITCNANCSVTTNERGFVRSIPVPKGHTANTAISNVCLRPESVRQTLVIAIPGTIAPTFDFVAGCSSSWSYEVKITVNNGLSSLQVGSIPILINSRPSATPMIYPPKALPADSMAPQQKYVMEEMPQAATNTVAPYTVGVPGSVSPGQAPYPQGVMMVPTNSTTLTASAPPGVYVPVSTDEIQR